MQHQALLGGFDIPAATRQKPEATVVSLFTGQLAGLRALQEARVSLPRPHAKGSFEARQELLDQIEIERNAAAAGEVSVVGDGGWVKTLTEAVWRAPAEAWSYGSWLFHRAETMVRSRPSGCRSARSPSGCSRNRR